MSCTPAEIAEKRRIALERLKKAKQNNSVSFGVSGLQVTKESTTVSSLNSTLQSPKSFYGNSSNDLQSNRNYENKIKTSNTTRTFGRIFSQPYPKSNPNSSDGSSHAAPNKNSSNDQITSSSSDTKNIAKVFKNTINCSCSMETDDRFTVAMSAYNQQLIEVFKSIPSKMYNPTTKKWTFLISDYELVQERVNALHPDVQINKLPNFVLKLLLQCRPKLDESVLCSIEPNLERTLLRFQKDGVLFGIEKQGRCMIADEMGLGKTYQALAIADFYKEDWPLLICTTAATRNNWLTKVQELLPYIPCHNVVCMTSNQGYFSEAKVLILSYAIMERNGEKLLSKNFGFIIFDESHLLKNSKANSTNVALKLSRKAKRVVLLTGTPALSRPSELFTQLQIIDKQFCSYKDFTIRYCAAVQSTFGWDASGQSNLTELNVVLNRKFLVRRLKKDVLDELAEKCRETVMLDSSLILKDADDEMKENMSAYARDYSILQGKERDDVLFRYYHETANAKRKAVCHYIKSLIKEKLKFIVFAHHKIMMKAIAAQLLQLHVDFIKIDGSTNNDLRAKYINTFQNDSTCRVALLSLKACNAGISLTSAQLIIFAELDWNPSTLAQAEGRAHRIGQDGLVTCRYLLASGTADDIIWNLLQKKQNILNRAGLFNENLSEAINIDNRIKGTIDKYLIKTNSTESESENQAMDVVPDNDTKDSNNNNNNNNNDFKSCFYDSDDEDLACLDY